MPDFNWLFKPFVGVYQWLGRASPSATTDLEQGRNWVVDDLSSDLEYNKYAQYRTRLRKSVEILKVHPMPDHWYGPGDSPPPRAPTLSNTSSAAATTRNDPPAPTPTAGEKSSTTCVTRTRNIFTRITEFVQGQIWVGLSLASWGHPSLHHLWVCILLEERGHPDMWDDGARNMWNRMNNMVLTAGLLLATAAVFATTAPPEKRAATLNWAVRGPYICIVGSLGLLVGGIIVGSCALMVITKAPPYWVRDVLHGSRWAVYGTMIMLAYPFISIGLATMLLAFGLLSAVWVATDTPIRWACAILLIAPVAVGILFAVICALGPSGSHLSAITFRESGTPGGGAATSEDDRDRASRQRSGHGFSPVTAEPSSL